MYVQSKGYLITVPGSAISYFHPLQCFAACVQWFTARKHLHPQKQCGPPSFLFTIFQIQISSNLKLHDVDDPSVQQSCFLLLT